MFEDVMKILKNMDSGSGAGAECIIRPLPCRGRGLMLFIHLETQGVKGKAYM